MCSGEEWFILIVSGLAERGFDKILGRSVGLCRRYRRVGVSLE